MEPLALLSSWVIIISSALALSTLDLKNLVALSTLRQLRLIFLLITLGLPSLALAHTLAHALFKARLFITAGAAIHQLADSQDPRRSRLSTSKSIVSSFCFLSLLGLSGIPLFSAYFSKETSFLAIESTTSSGSGIILLIIGSFFTILYSKRDHFSKLFRFTPLYFYCLHPDIPQPIAGMPPMVGFSLKWLVFPTLILLSASRSFGLTRHVDTLYGLSGVYFSYYPSLNPLCTTHG